MKFNWNEFKNGKVATYCKDKKSKEDFLQKCTDVGLTCYKGSENPINHCTLYDDIPYCYAYSTPHTIDLAYDTIEFFTKNNYKIIEWETENKIDYDREYNIIEVMEFPEDTEFVRISDGLFVKIRYNNNWECKTLINDSTKYSCKLSDIWTKSKFKLVKKDKKVECIEAMKAFDQGKTIKVKYINSLNKKEETKEYIPSFVRDAWCIAEEDSITPYLIAKGQWYIKED